MIIVILLVLVVVVVVVVVIVVFSMDDVVVIGEPTVDVESLIFFHSISKQSVTAWFI